ncbi:MAG: tRNA lysidine(34) synthetase TilS [Betaproteobacteria bacterium]|jgi:tRNA(Ile)-lysidine synthase
MITDVLVPALAASIETHGLSDATITVGLSGGIDSVVLLHLLRRGLQLPPSMLAAIHVNHQISRGALAWAAHCRRYCRELGVPLRVHKVEVARGNSTEAAAREARYRVFAQSGAAVIALAHNRDDQAETVLIQLLRGAGPRGLAAMPEFRAGEPSLWRPLLQLPRAAIVEYAERHRLRWIEDDSNADTHYTRNFLRHQVLPRIETRLPGASVVLARAARLQAEAAGLLDELARIDLGADDGVLRVDNLARLSPPRARNALRLHLRRRGLAMPDAARLDELLRQLLASRADARLEVDLGALTARRYRGELHLLRPLPPLPAGFTRRWSGRAELHLPELGGRLSLVAAGPGQGGLAAGWLGRLRVGVRSGGEGLRLGTGARRRSLRNLLQEAGLPPWLRDRWPLLHVGERLVAVPAIGVDADFQAAAGRPGWVPCWRLD